MIKKSNIIVTILTKIQLTQTTTYIISILKNIYIYMHNLYIHAVIHILNGN